LLAIARSLELDDLQHIYLRSYSSGCISILVLLFVGSVPIFLKRTMMPIYVLLVSIVLAQVLVPSGFNRLADYISPVYIICVFLVIRYYRNLPAPKKGARIYELPKKNIPWQDRFLGTWEKIERPGFKEVIESTVTFVCKHRKYVYTRIVLVVYVIVWSFVVCVQFAVWMGQSQFVAGLAEKQRSGNVIQYQDDSKKMIKIDITGVPAQPGSWVEVGKDKAPAVGKDPRGNPVLDTIWFNEEEKKLYRVLKSPQDVPKDAACETTQIREMTDDDKMIATVTCTRLKDNQTKGFKTIFVRA
jgi:hypothetical protein